jgi:hypothetical protein
LGRFFLLCRRVARLEVRQVANRVEKLAARERPEVKLAARERPEVKLAARERPEVKLAARERPEVMLAARERPEVMLAARERPEVKLAAKRVARAEKQKSFTIFCWTTMTSLYIMEKLAVKAESLAADANVTRTRQRFQRK